MLYFRNQDAKKLDQGYALLQEFGSIMQTLDNPKIHKRFMNRRKNLTKSLKNMKAQVIDFKKDLKDFELVPAFSKEAKKKVKARKQKETEKEEMDWILS